MDKKVNERLHLNLFSTSQPPVFATVLKNQIRIVPQKNVRVELYAAKDGLRKTYAITKEDGKVTFDPLTYDNFYFIGRGRDGTIYGGKYTDAKGCNNITFKWHREDNTIHQYMNMQDFYTQQEYTLFPIDTYYKGCPQPKAGIKQDPVPPAPTQTSQINNDVGIKSVEIGKRTDHLKNYYRVFVVFDKVTTDTEYTVTINGEKYDETRNLKANTASLGFNVLDKKMCPNGTGNSTFKFALDPFNKITETSETNNSVEIKVGCPAPTNQPPEAPKLISPTYNSIAPESVELKWEEPEDTTPGSQGKLNYRWYVRDIATNEKVWNRDWHTQDRLNKACKTIKKAQDAYTCTQVHVPASILKPGKTYAWAVEAGDGELGSGFSTGKQIHDSNTTRNPRNSSSNHF